VQDEPRQQDPTRRLLRVFGVTVTNYEERMGRLLERAAPDLPPAALLALTLEAIELTADLDDRLREMTAHVAQIQATRLGELRAAVQKAQTG
jgi:DNA replication initiation complex subunit (GINS family)